MTVSIATPTLPAIPPDLEARWRRIPVAVAVDLVPQCQISPQIRPLLPAGMQPALFGRALTVTGAPPDFGSVLRAVGMIGAGQVLIIGAYGNPDTAMIGDILGGHLHRKGAAGIVCDGAVRDVRTLAGFQGFSVYSRSITPRGPTGAAHGQINAPVTIGGCTVHPGDLILGDDDGLVCLPVALLADLIPKAEAKLLLEEQWTARLTAGDRVEDIFGLT